MLSPRIRYNIHDAGGERTYRAMADICRDFGLDLSGVEPTLHPLALANVWAEDEPRPSLPVDEALANAPDREDDAFRVPAG